MNKIKFEKEYNKEEIDNKIIELKEKIKKKEDNEYYPIETFLKNILSSDNLLIKNIIKPVQNNKVNFSLKLVDDNITVNEKINDEDVEVIKTIPAKSLLEINNIHRNVLSINDVLKEETIKKKIRVFNKELNLKKDDKPYNPDTSNPLNAGILKELNRIETFNIAKRSFEKIKIIKYLQSIKK